MHKRLREEASQVVQGVLVPILHFGTFLWQGNRRTPGKRVMKIRAVSLLHTHVSFWYAAERALGYGAALLEAGFGFLLFFLTHTVDAHRTASQRPSWLLSAATRRSSRPAMEVR